MTESDIDKAHLESAKADFRKALIGSLSGIELMSAIAKYLYADPFEYLRIERLKKDFPGVPEKLVGKTYNEQVVPIELLDELSMSLWPGI